MSLSAASRLVFALVIDTLFIQRVVIERFRKTTKGREWYLSNQRVRDSIAVHVSLTTFGINTRK